MTDPQSQQQQLFEWITAAEVPLESLSTVLAIHSPSRLAAYRRNHLYNRIAALSAAFPVVTALVGEAFFQEMASGYVTSRPATSPDLHQNGADFPAWIASYSLASELAYLPDVARLDWYVHRAFYAADTAVFDPNHLAAISPEQIGDLRFQFTPSVAVLPSPWPLAAIWTYHQPDSPRQSVDLQPVHHGVLVCRLAGRVVVQDLTAADLAAVVVLLNGDPFEKAVDAGLAIAPDYQPLGTLQLFIQQGALASVYLPDSSDREESS